MFKTYVGLGIALSLSGLSVMGADASLPRPLPAHPGNVFMVGESVEVAAPPESDWELRNYEDHSVSKGTETEGRIKLGALPAGWYQLTWIDKTKGNGGTTLSVLEPLQEAIPASSPVGIDAGMMYVFLRKKESKLDISYGPEEVASVTALAGINGIRDRMWWSAFDFLAQPFPEKEVPDLDFDACYAAHLQVVPVVFGAPAAYLPTEDAGTAAARKPPFQLDKINAYFQELGKRYPDSVHEWESWNEPEGIGGGILSYEMAAVQKAAYLGIKKTSPRTLISMGMGRIDYAEHLQANGYLDYIDTYNFHSHDKKYEGLVARFEKIKEFHGNKPLWLTELSSGSYPGVPGSAGELPLDQAKLQADSIPKLFSRVLFNGASKAFYFYLFFYTEENGRAFGLLREKDLTPRPGYNAIATVGRLLGSATSLPPRKLSELPEGGEGYQFSTVDHGKPTQTFVLWNEAPTGQWDWSVPAGSTVTDTIGRAIIPTEGKIKVGADPVYVVAADPVTRPPSPAVIKSPAPCPVVMNVILPDRYKNDVGDYLAIPAEENFDMPLDLYNFSDQAAAGTVTVTFPSAFKIPAQTFPVKLAAGAHVTNAIQVNFPRLRADGDKPDRINIKGDFGAQGQSIMALDFKVQVRHLSQEDSVVPVKGAEENTHWKATLIAKSEMKSRVEGGWTVFDWLFGPPSNAVVHQVWAAPSFPVAAEDIPSPAPDALAIDLRQVGGPKLKLAVNVVEKSGAAYVGFLDLNETDLRSENGTTTVVPFSGMINPPYRMKDDNGKLDVGDIRSVEIAAWTEPNSKVTLEFKNLRWVNLTYPNVSPAATTEQK